MWAIMDVSHISVNLDSYCTICTCRDELMGTDGHGYPSGLGIAT